MGSWDVDAQQVGTVLSATAAHIGEEGGNGGLLGSMDRMEKAVTGCESTAHSLPVSIALGEFCGHYFGVMGQMLSKTASGVEGASEATTAYLNGDLDMAAEAQSTAGQIPDPQPEQAPGAGRPV